MSLPTLLPPPPATANAEEHADWLEETALSSPRRSVSLDDLVGALRSLGSTDALNDAEDPDDAPEPDEAAVDRGSERAQAIAENALFVAEERSRSMIRRQRYPFVLRSSGVAARSGALRSTYAYLLLLSRYGEASGPAGENGAELFESVAAVAARNYMGGDSTGAVAYQFGFPRRHTPAGFKTALDTMCTAMREGVGAKNKPLTRRQKDAKLDLVVWLPMPDRQPGKVIGFGQCATGRNWPTKVSELNADAWCKSWMLEQPPVTPLRLFFLPHRIHEPDWLVYSNHAGVIFDRCRIAAYAATLPAGLRERTTRWSTYVLAAQEAAAR